MAATGRRRPAPKGHNWGTQENKARRKPARSAGSRARTGGSKTPRKGDTRGTGANMQVYNGSTWVKQKLEGQIARERNPQTEQAIARRQQGGSVPAGSFGISKAGRKKAAQNRQEAQSRNKPSSRPSSSGSKPTPRKPTRSPQAGSSSKKPTQAQKAANYKAWAKAHPEMAAKLKKGMSGYSETRGSSSSTSSRPQRGGDGAPGAQSNSLKSGNKTNKAKTSRLAKALQGVKRGGWKKRGSK